MENAKIHNTKSYPYALWGIIDYFHSFDGILLVAPSTLGFVLAGLGIFGVAGLSTIWRTIAVISSCVSLLLLILFWHPWLPVGVLIDLGTLIACFNTTPSPI